MPYENTHWFAENRRPLSILADSCSHSFGSLRFHFLRNSVSGHGLQFAADLWQIIGKRFYIGLWYSGYFGVLHYFDVLRSRYFHRFQNENLEHRCRRSDLSWCLVQHGCSAVLPLDSRTASVTCCNCGRFYRRRIVGYYLNTTQCAVGR